MLVAAVSTSGGFTAGTPKPLFADPHLRAFRGTPQYAALSDGQSFVLVDSVGTETANPPQIHIVQNWYEAFRNRERD